MRFLVSVKLITEKGYFLLAKKKHLFQALTILLNTLMVVMVSSKPYHSNEIEGDPVSQSANVETSDGVEDIYQGIVIRST